VNTHLEDHPRSAVILYVNRPKTCGLAIASLVCAIAGLFTVGLGSLAGLVLGIAALRIIKRSEGQLIGRSLIVAAIQVSVIVLLPIISYVAVVIAPWAGWTILPALGCVVVLVLVPGIVDYAMHEWSQVRLGRISQAVKAIQILFIVLLIIQVYLAMRFAAILSAATPGR